MAQGAGGYEDRAGETAGPPGGGVLGGGAADRSMLQSRCAAAPPCCIPKLSRWHSRRGRVGAGCDDINTMSFTTLLSAQIAEW